MNADQKTSCVSYRLERAAETLEEARLLISSEKFRGAVNRIYYAMFYSVSALALLHEFVTSSHGQLRGFFNREFVKTGRIPSDLGEAYGVAFDSRTKGDYDDLVTFGEEQAQRMFSDAERFIEAVVEVIKAAQAEGKG